MGKKSQKTAGGDAHIQDPRFASFETDPRFRLPSKKNAKTKLDKRFSRMLEDDEFMTTAKVDRYGRKVSVDKKKKALERLYQKDSDEEEEEEEEEDEDKDEDDETSEKGDGTDDESAVEEDSIVQRELRALTAKYDPARDGGFSSSDEDSEDDDINEEDEAALKGSMQRLADEQAEVEEGEVTRRVAIVNLDWDYVKAADLMALFTSFLPAKSSGKVTRVSVYPSEFGKERMAREELEGPPKDIFKAAPKVDDINNKKEEVEEQEEEEDSDMEDERIKQELLKEATDQDFDSDALRGYQLDRLRYFYAVMECSDAETAKALYDQTDGTEYLSSSNFLDLRFIPDDVTFDDEPRDEVTKVPKGYKPVEFVTNALQSSKVKLTWDMHPEEAQRKESMRKAFSGSRDDIEENDLRAYLASEGSDSEPDDEEEASNAAVPAASDEPKLSKKELARRKMREALGLSAEPTSKKSDVGPVGDMQITFTSALTEKETKKKDPNEEETTLEKYMRKERERKEKKRARSKTKRGDGADEAEDPAGSDVEMVFGDTEGADLGFDDPFFTAEDPSSLGPGGGAPASKTAQRKEERLKKRAEREQKEAALAAEKKKLAAVMAENEAERAGRADHLDHFDMADIRKAERAEAKGKKGRKAKRGKKAGDDEEKALQTDYKVPVDDTRFGAVFTEHEFAIDPSNPKFSGTAAMKTLLEEGRKKRKNADTAEGERRKKKKSAEGADTDDIKGLVESVKRKAKKN
ncbi:Pre-rRNA-processing protein ESF1 [Ceratocystis fimbriata CBS 114723]|uniref:Pre-rRNA-processing protein ESF1 n=1 Tax=Ceratocystis fimbriata CBS 114723 TaxID=1035309 RepID=A0A2C5WUJ5_9PEZI|nr:Pre-rRNA-processing protein ESF1 [Ceratocystis fimbriata CBS 114723]